MRRGEVWLADLEPVRGSEADKRRPVVLVSSDAANMRAAQLGRGVVTVVPLTSNVARILRFQTLIPPIGSLTRESKAQPEQVRSIDASRLGGGPIASVPRELMREIDDGLRLHLDL